ncbi:MULTISPECIES: M20 family metallopeptidase [unclassified Microbacterium]|uniref:M20 metallopeptidase family protein n=1 Tax=unclassified Microbacterium TaxID=2609290 RepID=UPI00069F3200|nr:MULTISPECIES: M20 family metallopeptidase [unclassified Microbacterium]AKV87693.1 amidohydrolase [Microbacterium sp. CGR1]MBC6495433.1 amidohydrolase [Microbacterium sp. 4-7]
MSAPDFAADAVAILPDLVALRRALHADPELGLDLPRTQQKVLDALEGLPLEITTGTRTTSVVAVLRGGRPGPAVLLRGDMDALPIEETTGLEFASTNGTMHACGHDLHTAGLVGAARLLSERRDELHGSVIFMFQPGEEGHGGAKVMIEEGLLDAAGERPVAAYAIHVAPGPRGLFATRSGAVAAGSNQLFVTVDGRGGHGSQPHQTLDPVPAAAEIVLALQSFVTRRFDAFDPVVLSVTRLSTGEGAVNVIPEQVELAATVRNMSPASLATLQEGLPRVIEGVAAAHGLTADVRFDTMYPVTVNDPAETAETVDVLQGVFGEQRVVIMPTPMMGSEDFAFVLDEVPGTFIALMTSPPDADPSTIEWNHSPRVLFDDAVLGDQAAALASVAFARTAR